MLQCTTCSNVTVWTQVCTAPMTQLPHLTAKLADQGHKARELHTAVQQPPPGTASVNTSLTYTLKCGVKVRVLLPSSNSRRLPPSLSCSTDSTGHDISVTSFCSTPVFSLRLANCRQTQQDGKITEHVSWSQSEL